MQPFVMHRAALLVLVLAFTLVPSLSAQRLPMQVRSVRPLVGQDTTYREVPSADLWFLGALGGAIGCIPGAMVGGLAAGLGGQGKGDIAGLGAVVTGCAVGITAGLATGVHLGNHRRGSFWLDLATAFGVAILGTGVATIVQLPPTVGWVVPIAMVGLTVAIEKRVERRH